MTWKPGQRRKQDSFLGAWVFPLLANKIDIPTGKKMSHLEEQNRKYRQHYKTLLETEKDESRAAELSVGGQFERFGKIELALLQEVGFGVEDLLVDVGCGTGRLAIQLSKVHSGPYLGTDVVDDMLVYAGNLVGRPDWNFQMAEGLAIPSGDNTAKIVCFFSVMTHLLHEQSFIYLREAYRVLQPGGSAVFSFLEFKMRSHWPIFERDVETVDTDRHIDVFMDRDGISLWAEKLGFRDLKFLDGDKPMVEVDGNKDSLGQSVAILTK
jgi:SAM-dependent methyltransferase